jgi:hypothetical protein
MTRSRACTLTAGVLAGLAVPSICFMSPASATLIDRGTVHFEEHFVDENSCGVVGLTVQIDITFDGRFTVNSRGDQRLPYFRDSRHVAFVFTNVATGNWVAIDNATRGNDIRATDNGDGTLTYLTQYTTNRVMRDQAGSVIARDTGQARFRILVDDAGTPTDPSDDSILDYLGDVKPPTGRNDDFCAATVEAIG